MIKAAIITLHRVYNYGSALQAYATQKIFENAGFDTEIIDYITPERTMKRKLSTLPPGVEMNLARKVLYRIAKFFSIIRKEMTFGSFVRNNLNLTNKYITSDDLEKNPPKADLYVTGSDQTWNSFYNQGVDRGFFLDFLPVEAKRVAFVSSFGKDKLDDFEIDETKSLLNNYLAISVREDSAAQIVKKLGISEPVQLIDPTLQINKNDWALIASKRLIKQRYLILMLLYNEDNHATEYARRIADIKGLKLVKLSWELKKPALVDILLTHRSPSDFLSLFQNADFVVTNSFHGTAFSINFEKQFVVVPRSEFNTRIQSLLDLCGLSNRLVDSIDEAVNVSNVNIDYKLTNSVIENERNRAIKYLNELKVLCDVNMK